ncbi:MAG: prepilin peptidase [Candidatus Paceibacterota bacterium]
MIIESIFVFIFGLLVGSFLNCVIWRTYKNQSFMRGRSYCPRCKQELSWLDLVPLFSFLFLRGRCRYCKKPISIQYPLVELVLGLLFVFIYNYFKIELLYDGFTFAFYNVVFLWAAISLLAIAFVYDLKHYIIPDGVTFLGIGLTIAWIIFGYLQGFYIEQDVVGFIVAAAGATIFFFILWFFSKGRAMGFGDVKLVFFLGLLLGITNTAVALFISFISGAIIGLILIALRKKKLKSSVPFGPFLVAGTFVALFYGTVIKDWYLSLSNYVYYYFFK